MKQLSIEEKAKAYDEAKINGSRLWECGEITKGNYEYMFPELKESVNIVYISGIRKELLDIENNAENIVGLTESQWVAIRAAHRLLGEYIAKEQKPAWKPSDEQIKLLREVQQALLGKDCHNRFVNFMYELKRLREE